MQSRRDLTNSQFVGDLCLSTAGAQGILVPNIFFPVRCLNTTFVCYPKMLESKTWPCGENGIADCWGF